MQIFMNALKKGINKGAFAGQLNCPACESAAIRFVEMIGPYRLRYRCRKCGMPFQYETGRDLTHPYSPFNKAKYQEIIRNPKGVLPGRK